MIVTTRTRERSNRARYEHDAQIQPRRTYSYERAGRLWTPRLELLGGGPGGAFATRSGAGDDLWQPTSVSGFIFDIDPKHQLTTGLDGARVTVASVVNNAPSASDSFANGNASLQPTFEPTGWGGSFLRPSILFNGTSYYLVCSTGLASALVGGTDTPFWLFMVGHFVTTPGGASISCPFFLGSSSGNNPLWDWFANVSEYRVFKRENAGGAGVFQGGGVPDTGRHVFDFNNTATPTTEMLVDSVSLLSGALSAGGALTVDIAALGATYANSSPNNFSNFRLARVLGGAGAISAPDAAYIRGTLNALYF